jgi:hypothetical protein
MNVMVLVAQIALGVIIGVLTLAFYWQRASLFGTRRMSVWRLGYLLPEQLL